MGIHELGVSRWVGAFVKTVAACAVVGVACGPAWAQNEIVAENALPGSPQSEWDVAGAGDPSIQGFATDISVDQGETVFFKIDTPATAYHLDIYRMGYYGGMGARKVAGPIAPTATLPGSQPACLTDPGVGLTDCGNWAVSASWTVPANATSGIYFAKVIRDDGPVGASHIVFIVRDDDGGSDILFQTSDTTWQAYNTYGGSSLYTGSASNPPAARAHKISYNRPFSTRGGPLEDWVFNAEYPMVRWLERNGYDVSYFTDVDSDRRGTEILEHQVWMSTGHDEYWSAGQRASVEAARAAGVHLAFFSGNEIYWKIRWENSTDGSNVPYRTLVCYKEGTLGENNCGGKCDPLANVWTGLWRDGCAFSPPADGCNPENALSGQISWVGSTGSIQVPDTYSRMPLWRNTGIASLTAGQTATLAADSLGYEWDPQQPQYASSYPPLLVSLSSTGLSGATHRMSLYRHASGALVFGAGTVQWSWGLDGNHDRGVSTENVDMQQATVNLLADMGVAPATLQANLVPATASSDTTPPTSAISSPSDGSTATAGTVVAITGTASDTGGGDVVLVQVSVDGGTTWRDAQGFENWTYNWTPTVAGPATILSRAVDGTLNVETPGPGVDVTVEPRVCPCSIWGASVTPTGGTFNDGQPIEVGMKFRSSQSGFITALRFWKAPQNVGTHTGHLWTASGTLLAEAVFTGESASGWQEVVLGTPVAIAADTTYVASYHGSGGYYTSDSTYFAVAADNPPLRGLASGEDGPNGVYLYSVAGAFPTQNFQQSNYWVDVVYSETAEDTQPPTVIARTPAPGTGGVSTSTTVAATFNEPVSAPTITFELRDPGSALVPAAVAYDAPSRRVTLTPSAALDPTTTYTATVSGAQDLAANTMTAPVAWSFTTGAPPPPPPDQGPGGPILVIGSAADSFGRYFAEILRTEGFNYFTVTYISEVTPALLAQHLVVILGEMSLSAGEVTLLSDWVSAGGKLIAMRPDPQLAGLLGLTADAATLAEGYLQVDTASPPGLGIVGETIQYHGTADLYTLSGATEIAALYSDATTATPHPAVTLVDVGSNGGQAAAFTYDLARSVVYTRQGNPAWAGQERDGVSPVRSDDMFFPDWIDLDKVAIPQADEQQRLLANLILHMSAHPLPRFWYFPRGLRAAVIMTGDQHGCCAGTSSRFATYVSLSAPGCSVADWECVRASSYIYPGSGMTDTEGVSWTDLGFELGAHIDTGCADWTPAQLDNFYTIQLATFAAQFPSLPVQDSERTHCIAWSDWSTQATVKAGKGIRLDTNYYYWPPSWVQDRPGMFTGSGMPMRFADLDGTMIDVYQAATQMTDESGQTFPFTVDALLDKAIGPEGYYGAFTANMHTDSASHAGSDAIVASALARGIPVVSGRQMLEWLDGRNASAFQSVSWSGGVLSFTVSVGVGATNLRAMIPARAAVGTLTGITRDGSPVAFTTETVKGVDYGAFSAIAGDYQASYLPDTTPPVISNLAAAPAVDGTVTITWNTDEPADSRVDYDESPGTLNLNASDPALVTSHSILLTGLTPGTTHHFRVTSADAAANSATEPAPPDPPATFVTAPPACFVDDLFADFELGTGPGAHVSKTGDGEVILEPAEGSEFEGASLPADWTSALWGAGGTVAVSGGALSVNGARANTVALHGPGRSVEFVGTFNASTNQHAGFAVDFNAPPWAMLSTMNTTTTLFARTHDGSTAADVAIAGSFVGAPHRYRIDWNDASVDFYVDGSLVHSQSVTIGASMRPIASDFADSGPALSVDWMRMTPYSAASSFESRVFDAGTSSTWGTASWNVDLPAGTTLNLFVRTGGTPVPDGSWTPYAQIVSPGGSVGATSRYIRYRADLTTSDAAGTPALEDVTISCLLGDDTVPPVITNVAAAPGASTATITWNTDEPADSRVVYGTDPSALIFWASDGSPVTSHLIALGNLSPGTTYYYRVISADPSANSATAPPGIDPPLSFTTTTPVCGIDTTVADFSAGTGDAGIHFGEAADGEVLLAPTVGAEFGGTTLPPGWVVAPWNTGGTAAVAGGVITIDSVRVNPINANEPDPPLVYGPGRSLEFVATFNANAQPSAAFQHVGFGGGNDSPAEGGQAGEMFNTSPWAMFSTGSSGTTLLARVWNGGPFVDIDVGASCAGGTCLESPHRFRIDWGASSITFFIDGTLVHTETTETIAANMRPALSDFSLGGATLAVDRIVTTPYGPAGTFNSRIHDAGEPRTWANIAWSSTEPAGTGLALSVRTGNTPTPDGTWTTPAPIPSSGSSVGQTGRYIQYIADLSTSAPDETPTLMSLSIQCLPCTVEVGPSLNFDSATDLSWTGSAPSYRLYRGTLSTAGWSFDHTCLATNLTSPSATDSEIPAGTGFYYLVSAVNACGEGTLGMMSGGDPRPNPFSCQP